MKKHILILLACIATLSGFSQLATVSQQTIQSVKLDSIAARLIRGSILGGATAANQATQTTSLGVINTSLGTINTSVGSINTTLASQATAVRQDSMNARLLSIKKFEDTLRYLIRTLNTRIATNASVTLSGGTATVAAGENFIGQTGHTFTVTGNTITTNSTTSYDSGDNIGAINTVTNAIRVANGTGEITDLFVWDKENQKPNIVIDIWSASPTVGTYTDNSPEVIFGDQSKWLGQISVASSDYQTQGVVARATIKNIGLLIKSAGGTKNIFFTIATTSTPTYSSASGLIIGLGIKQN